MKYLGFANVFVILIMSCLSSVSYSVSSNTQKDVQVRIQHFLGVPAIRQYEKYLGLLALAAELRSKVSFISRKGFGGNYKAGRKSICPRQVEKFS